MEMSIVAGFWVVSFLLIMTPGADWAYAISAGIHGRRVVPAVMGLMSGHLLATLIVVAGVGVMMAQHPLALSGLTIAGALYLLWLGISLLRAPGAPESATTSAANWKQWAVKGLCISGLNPKVFCCSWPCFHNLLTRREAGRLRCRCPRWACYTSSPVRWSICWWDTVQKPSWPPARRPRVW